MALTRRQGTNIGLALAVVILVPLAWAVLRMPVVEQPETLDKLQQHVKGPNPDGSWGLIAGLTVQVRGVVVNREAKEITIHLLIDSGTGEKYLTHATLPLDSTIEED